MIHLLRYTGPFILGVAIALLLLLHFAIDTDSSNNGADKAAVSKAKQIKETSVSVSSNTRPKVYYNAITDRPLFTPDRRPVSKEREPQVEVVEPEVGVDDKAEISTNITIYGILKTGDRGSALMSFDDGERQWIQLNKEISGWTLTQISSEWVKVKNNNDEIKIWLYDNN